MNNLYVITSTTQYTDPSGDEVCTYYFLINGAYEAYITLDEAGEYQDGTFKEGSDPVREMRAAIESN